MRPSIRPRPPTSGRECSVGSEPHPDITLDLDSNGGIIRRPGRVDRKREFVQAALASANQGGTHEPKIVRTIIGVGIGMSQSRKDCDCADQKTE